MAYPVDTHFPSYEAVKGWWDYDIGCRKKKKYVNRISIARNTWLCKYPRGVFRIIFHHTPIITYRSDGSIELNYGEYKTHSTKMRMNKFLPKGFKVFQRQKDWYVYAQWQLEAMEALGQSYKQIRKNTKDLWDLAKKFSGDGKCLISGEEMLFYSLGKVGEVPP